MRIPTSGTARRVRARLTAALLAAATMALIVPVVASSAAADPVDVVKGRYFTGTWVDRAFFPDGDGQSDTIGGEFCLSESANVTITVVPDGGGAVVRTIESGVSRVGGLPLCNSSSWNQRWSWDGKTDAGVVAADGRYRVLVSATDAQGDSDVEEYLTEIDTKPVGIITTPTTGSTIAGLARLAFRPGTAPGLERVDFCFQTGGRCESGFNSSADGLWRTSVLTGLLPAGPNVLKVRALVRDSFGQTHTREAFPTVDVVTDNTSIPLIVSATPTEGVAPLETELSLTASDPGGRELAYTVQWGDGTSQQTGALVSPYPTVRVTHRYATPGSYQPRVTVTNGQGGSAQNSVILTVRARTNAPPTATLGVSASAGVAPLALTASAEGSDPDADPITYRLDWGDNSPALSGSGAPPASTPHTYTRSGSFIVRLEVSDGSLAAVRTSVVRVGLSEPLRSDAGDDRSVVIATDVEFDGRNSRPLVGIEQYRWEFGDGQGADGPTATHRYQIPGTYTATLWVTAAGSTVADTTVVRVGPPPRVPGLKVTIRGPGGVLAGAEALVIRPDGSRVNGIAGSDGLAVLNGLADGDYAIYVRKNGYRPEAARASVADGNGELTVTLTSGEVGAATLESRTLTLEEIIDRGIDVEDPANTNVYEATINLFFVPEGPDPEPVTHRVTVTVAPSGVSSHGPWRARPRWMRIGGSLPG